MFEFFDLAIQKGSNLWSPIICQYLESVNPEKVIPYYEHGYSVGDSELKYTAAERLCIIYSGNFYPQLRCREKYDYWLNEMRKYKPDSPDIFDEPDFVDWGGNSVLCIVEYMLAIAQSEERK